MNSVIVLNWNTTDLLIDLVESIKKYTHNPLELIVVDNGSRKEEYEKLLVYFNTPCLDFDVIIRRLEENLGFAAGNNVGLSLVSTSNNVVFINSDILIQEENWDLKFDEILSQENVGVCGCSYHPLTWSADARFKILPKANHPVESQSVQGAFFAIRKDVLDKVFSEDGCWFDENFKFAQYEETDLQFRIIEKGFRCIWALCEHLHLYNNSGTKANGYKLSKDIQNINDFRANAERNRQLLFKKHKDFLERNAK